MRQIKAVWKATLLIAGAALMTVLLWLLGTMVFVASTYEKNAETYLSVGNISNALVQTKDGYSFSEAESLYEHNAWAMLIGDNGDVVWSFNKPSDVPEHYSICDVAAFSKWYLKDYPVQSRIREDGLFVLGRAKFSTWKYNIVIDSSQFTDMLIWTVVMLALSLLCVVAFSALLLKCWIGKEQRLRDTARADWINGVSHDIRTPLSLVMGYSSQLSQNESLPAECRKQADIILSQSQMIKALIGDLNLTMRLSYNMEPLHKENLDPLALLRQSAADLINAGLDERYRLELDIPDNAEEKIFADAQLLRRALKNLLDNCVRHNKDGCCILLKLNKDKKYFVFTVESRGDKPVIATLGEKKPAEHGEPVHGTGLKLVRRIATVHGGALRYLADGNCFLCELMIPRHTGSNR